MLGVKRLATSKLAAKVHNDSFEPILYSGRIAAVSQKVGIVKSGRIAKVMQSVGFRIEYSGRIARASQSVVAKYSGRIAKVSQSVNSAQQQYPFSADVAFDDFGTFGLRIVCDGLEVPICDYMNNIQITFEEDKAALAKMSFKQESGAIVNLHQYLNKPMRIELPKQTCFCSLRG